jgi:hypothetical protein
MEASGKYAVYRGRRLPAVFFGAGSVGVPADNSDSANSDFPDATEFGEGRSGPWVRLPESALTRLCSVTVRVEWRGEVFGLGKVLGEEALLYGGTPARAAELGLEGDQYMGYSVTVPLSQVTLVEVEEREIT